MKISYKIKAETGLHGRAANMIVNKCKEFNSDISIVFIVIFPLYSMVGLVKQILLWVYLV